jgi:hypothetical protein
MRVSTVISADTRAAGPRRSLESLCYLDWTDFSVIVVNGPSADASDAVVKESQDLIRGGACAYHRNVHGVKGYMAEPSHAYSLRRCLEALIHDGEGNASKLRFSWPTPLRVQPQQLGMVKRTLDF